MMGSGKGGKKVLRWRGAGRGGGGVMERKKTGEKGE